MTRNTYRRNSALGAWLAVALGAAPAAAQVVAERGADQITDAQARTLLASLDPDARAKLLADPNGVQTLLRDALVQRAILEEATAQHWEQRPDIAALLARTRDAAIVESFLAAEAMPPAGYPSPTEIQAAYDRNRSQLMQPRTYRLAQLFIAAPTQGQAAARRVLADLRAQLLRSRAPFQAGAKHPPAQYADLGWVAENRLQPQVKSAVAGLLEGQVSDPVCTETGCTLLKLIATRPAGPAPLAEVQVGLVRLMRQQKQRELEQAYAESLIRKLPVRVNEIELSHLTQP